MFAVDEMEFSPLIDVERAEGGVAGTLAPWAKESLRFGKEQVEVGEMFGCGVGEVFAGKSMGGGLRGDDLGGFAACGEVSASGDCALEDAVREVGPGAGGSALGEAGDDGG